MDEGLRADDFRRAWPTALAVAMRETAELTSQIEKSTERVEAATRDAVMVAELLPQMVKELRTVLQAEGAKLLEGSRAELLQIREDAQKSLAEASTAQKVMIDRLAELEKLAAHITRQRELLRAEQESRKKKWFHFFR